MSVPYYLAVCALAFGLAVPAFFTFLSDDAFIHARIAEHLFETGEPYFNLGVAFKASSSTGYTFVLAATRFFLDAEASIRTVTAVSIAALTILVFHFLQLVGIRGLPRLFYAFGLLSTSVWAAYGGMETAIASSMITAAAIAQFRDRPHLAVFLVALAACFRFECIALLGLVSAICVWNHRSWRISLALIPVIMLALIELHFFGTLIPNAARAKAIAYGFPLLDSIRNNLSFGFLGNATVLGLLAIVVGLAAATSVFVQYRTRQPAILALYLFATAVLCVWALSRSLIFNWYYGLFATPFVLATILVHNLRSMPYRFPILAGANIVVTLLLYLGVGGCIAHMPTSDNENAERRVLNYLQIGAALHAQCPECSLVTSEIGGLGYSFKGTVYDAFALADPEALPFHPMKVPEERNGYFTGAIPPAYVDLRKPDFIVSFAIFSKALRDSGKLDRYRQYDCKIDGKPIWGEQYIEVFSLRELNPVNLKMAECRPH